MAKNTISSGLKKAKRKQTLPPAGSVAATGNLAERLNTDRINRRTTKGKRMTWPEYALFLGVKLSTVYKIAKGSTTRPHETTVAQIEDRLAEAGEGASEVVPSGQRQPERS